MKRERILKTIFVSCLVIMALTFVIIQPPQAAPDEGMKMTTIKYMADNHKLPRGNDPEILDETWGTSYGFTPYIPYIFSAIFINISRIFVDDEWVQYSVSRLPSTISYLLFIVFIIKIADKLFKEKYQKWLFTLLLVAFPGLLFTGSYINIDMFALFTQSLIVYSWIRGLHLGKGENRKDVNNERKIWDTKSCVYLGIGVGLCALSYYNAYGYILTSVIIFIVSSIINRLTFKEFIKNTLIVSLIALAIAGWFFVRNAIIYDGDFLALTVSDECSEQYAEDKFKPSQRYLPANEHLGMYEFFRVSGWGKTTLFTFVAAYGQLFNLRAYSYTYIFYLMLAIVAVVGYLLKFYKFEQFKSWGQDKYELTFDIVMIFNMIIPFCLSVYYSYFSDFQPQGRYLYPMIIPVMYFSTLGLNCLIEKIKNETAKKIVITALYAMIIIALACFMIPAVMYFSKV